MQKQHSDTVTNTKCMSKLSEERFLKVRGGDMAYVANNQKILNFDKWVVFVAYESRYQRNKQCYVLVSGIPYQAQC